MISAIVCEVVAVHDGDTLACSSGTRIRLAGIDANEMDGSCHNACAPMSATASRDHLAQLVQGKTIACEPTGTSYRRVVAWCTIGGVMRRIDLSCAQVRAGAVIRWARYDPDGRLRGCE